MKQYHLALGAAVLAATMLTACDKPANPGGHAATPATQDTPTRAKGAALNSEEDKLSYAIGMDIGNSLKGLNVAFNREALYAAIGDQLDGKDPAVKPDEAAKIKQAFFQKRAEEANKKRAASAGKNAEEGKKFREEYARGKNVKTTASGLMYEVLKEGDGPRPKATDKVTVNYRGTLIDGTEFDSSYKRGQPATFPLNGVIKGWTEGVQLMRVGSKYKFVLPPELAYGANGAGRLIGPNATLVFEVELLSIEGK